MKHLFPVLAVLAGFIFVSSMSWAGEYFPGQGYGQVIQAGYYKVVRPKIKPEDEEKRKAEEAKRKEDEKKNPKKKHHRHRRNGKTPLHIEQVQPQKVFPPTLVPDYDSRPDTFPND